MIDRATATAIGLVVFAQMAIGVTPGDRFAWEQPGPGLPAIQSYRYELEIDGAVQRAPLTGVQCHAVTPAGFECDAEIPATPLGSHALRVRAIDTSVPGVDAVEGNWSPLLVYVMRPPPAAPSKVRVVKKGKG